MLLEPSAFLTVSHVARALERSESTVRQMAKRGVLPCVVLSSGARVFEIEAVERVRQQLKAQSAESAA
jgi:hypothetical protein